jgi:predicted nucleic-acid-binding protein
MKILRTFGSIDSNIALDAILKREPFYNSAEKIIGLSQGGIGLFISASAITDIYYILEKNAKTCKILR